MKQALPKLYGFWLSPYMSMVANVLHEVGISYQYVRVSTLSGGNHTDSYRAINPNMKVPAFVDTDGTVVTESLAICRYIARRYPQARQLYPVDDAAACAAVDAKTDFLAFHVGGPYFNWFVVSGHFPIAWGLQTQPESTTYAQWSAFLVLGEMQRFVDCTDFAPFVCGATPTVADFQLFYMLEHGRTLSRLYQQPELDLLAGNTTLATFYDEMAARDSTTEVLQARADEAQLNSHELMNDMQPAYQDMLDGAKVALAEMFGHPV